MKSGTTNGAKKRAVNPRAVQGRGVSNQPPPSGCHTRNPDSGYARQKAVIGKKPKEMIPAHLEFRGAAMEPTRKPTPNNPTPAKVNQRRNQPGSLSPRGSHQVPNLARTKSPTKKPSPATSQLNTVFIICRIAAKRSVIARGTVLFPWCYYFRHQRITTCFWTLPKNWGAASLLPYSIRCEGSSPLAGGSKCHAHSVFNFVKCERR